MEECGELVGSKRGFHAAIRNCEFTPCCHSAMQSRDVCVCVCVCVCVVICGVVQVSFQSVTINLLTEYLGDMDGITHTHTHQWSQ